MDDTDHDILIRLEARFAAFHEESGRDRAFMHEELGDMKAKLTALENASNQVRGGARVVSVIWGAIGMLIGVIGSFLALYKHP